MCGTNVGRGTEPELTKRVSPNRLRKSWIGRTSMFSATMQVDPVQTVCVCGAHNSQFTEPIQLAGGSVDPGSVG